MQVKRIYIWTTDTIRQGLRVERSDGQQYLIVKSMAGYYGLANLNDGTLFMDRREYLVDILNQQKLLPCDGIGIETKVIWEPQDLKVGLRASYTDSHWLVSCYLDHANRDEWILVSLRTGGVGFKTYDKNDFCQKLNILELVPDDPDIISQAIAIQ